MSAFQGSSIPHHLQEAKRKYGSVCVFSIFALALKASCLSAANCAPGSKRCFAADPSARAEYRSRKTGAVLKPYGYCCISVLVTQDRTQHSLMAHSQLALLSLRGTPVFAFRQGRPVLRCSRVAQVKPSCQQGLTPGHVQVSLGPSVHLFHLSVHPLHISLPRLPSCVLVECMG